MCGKLVSIEDIPGTPSSYLGDAQPVPHERIQLFAVAGGADCCASAPAAEILTDNDGSFRFQKIAPGDYWVVTTFAMKEYKLQVRYRPAKASGTKCWGLLYAIEKDGFRLRRLKKATAE
jgi:hypothetical protein